MNVLDKIIENINLHKKKSTIPIVDNQVTYIPKVEDGQIEYMTFSYIIDGQRTKINQSHQCCFRLRYIKAKRIPPRVEIQHSYGIWSMYYLLDAGIIQPFMLFINGRFIPWDMISIIADKDTYHLLVDCESYPNYASLIRDIEFVQMVTLPDHLRFDPDYHDLDPSVAFSFDSFGVYNPGAADFVVRTRTDAHHIIWNYWTTTVGVNAFPVLQETSVKLTEENVILFRDGFFATGTREVIRKAFDDEYEYDNGFISTCLSFSVEDIDLQENPSIKFDSELLTIGDGAEEGLGRLDFGVFINTKYTPTVDNINRTDLYGLAPYIEDQNAGIDNPDFLQELQVPFEMQMDRTKKYSENVDDAINTMMAYNASLFNEVLEESSNLIIEEHDGQWVLDAVDDSNMLSLSRYHDEMVDEYILMLVNGELYQYYHMAKYKVNKCYIPIQGINPEDRIELLRFQNVNNYELDITVNEDDGYLAYSPDYINETMILFSTDPHECPYSYPADGLQHFPVEYSLDTDENGGIKITLADSYYYGKPLHIAYRNKFRHYRFVMEESYPEKYTVNLGNKFMYCPDYDKFLVFYNRRRLGSDQYRLTLPVRKGTPFYSFEIYLTMPISNGDILDVVYVPSIMRDVILIPELPLTGDIVVDKTALGYGLSKDLYMVWINGKKIPKSCITDIDSTNIRITTDVQSIKMVCLTKYIEDIELLSVAYQANNALWDSAMAKLTHDEITALLGIVEEELTNTEPGIYDNAIGIRTIMYELIREQFMMNPEVDTTGAFVYDYLDVDTTAVDGYDAGGNAVLPTGDANLTDNLSDVHREWP